MTEPTTIPYLCGHNWFHLKNSFFRVEDKGYEIKPIGRLNNFLEDLSENKYPLVMIALADFAPGEYRDEVIDEILEKSEHRGFHFIDNAKIGVHAIKKTKEISDASILVTSDKLFREYNKEAEKLGAKVLNILTDDFKPENILTTIEGLLAK